MLNLVNDTTGVINRIENVRYGSNCPQPPCSCRRPQRSYCALFLLHHNALESPHLLQTLTVIVTVAKAPTSCQPRPRVSGLSAPVPLFACSCSCWNQASHWVSSAESVLSRTSATVRPSRTASAKMNWSHGSLLIFPPFHQRPRQTGRTVWQRHCKCGSPQRRNAHQGHRCHRC